MKMDMKNKPLILVLIILFIGHVSASAIPPPRNVEVHISEDEVIVRWENPENAPSDTVYNVQMRKYVAKHWDNVSSCMGITRNYCILTADIKKINEYQISYKVQVQLVKGDQQSDWKWKKFLLNEGDLQPPSFSLQATSSTLTVSVHEKPILREIYPYGVTYTLYLEEIDQENKTTTVYLEDDNREPDGRKKMFTGLQWGKKYCISVEVKGNGGLYKSNVSEKQCLLLPEQEFYIIAVSSLSILGTLIVVMVAIGILLVYLKRPAKTPVALKSPVSGWQPLSVREESMEVVTDKGWFLSSHRPDAKPTVNLPETSLTIIEDGEEENRRTSLDSGVIIEANSTGDNRGQRQERQDDSGCGSMGGPEISAHSHTDYPMQEESMEADDVSKREDSGMGLDCPHHSSFLKLDSQDTQSLVETVVVGSYRTQSPASEMQVQSRDSEDTLKQIPVLADVVTGYKPGPQSCICSQTGQCSWCHRHGSYGPKGTKLCREVCIENMLLGGTSDLVDSSRVGKIHMDSVITNLEESFLHVSDTFPLLTSKYKQDSNMNNVSLSLCDVQLTTD